MPGGKDQERGDGREIVEELAAGAELLPGGAPEFVGDVADGVNGEGQQVQSRQDGGEVALAVTEIVLDVVSLGLENVEGLVLDLPAGATAGREFGDIVGPDRQVGNETVAVGDSPWRLTISISNQLTLRASLPPSRGTSLSQR